MSETHSTTENNNSHCCDNTCGNADDRVVPDSVEINPLFARPKEAQAFSKFTIPQKGSLPETAYQVVHDEAMLDGNARLNLATFVSTWMDDHANRLYMEAADKNMIDKDEYPKTAEVESRCWHMLADLWHAPDPMNAENAPNKPHRNLHHRLVGSLHAGRTRVEAPLEGSPRKGRPADRSSESGDEQRRAGVLGEVLQLFRRGTTLCADFRGPQSARRP